MPGFLRAAVAARAGASISAWLGQMTAARHLDALRVLGVPIASSVAGPAWLGLALAAMLSTFTFAAALTLTFIAYLLVSGEAEPMRLLSAFGSQPLVAAVIKTGVFGVLVAATTTASAHHRKRNPDEIATDLTQAIMVATITIMLCELLLLVFEFATP